MVDPCVVHVREPCKNGWTDRDAILGLTQVGPSNHILDGGPYPFRVGQFWGLSAPLISIAVVYVKTAERSRCHFGGWIVCPRNHVLVLDGGQILWIYLPPWGVTSRQLGHTSEPFKNGWTDRDAIWGWLMLVQGNMMGLGLDKFIRRFEAWQDGDSLFWWKVMWPFIKIIDHLL